jgi:hypothetical protein
MYEGGMMTSRIVLAAFALFAQPLLAHTGHSAPPAHIHGWGIEHVALLGVALVAVLLARHGRK